MSEPAPIIGFGHQSRVGKDTCAQAVIRMIEAETDLFAIKGAFADLLKHQAHCLWGHLGLQPARFYEEACNERLRYEPLPKIGKSPVDLWIELGQEVRGIYSPTWAEACLSRARPGAVLVISDIRFDNEGDAIREMGGFCIKVTRDGQTVRGSDRMIREDFPWDAVIVNDGSIEDLQRKAEMAARGYLQKRAQV